MTATFEQAWETQPELEGEQFFGLARRFAPHILAAIMASGQPNSPVVKAATQIARTYADRERRRAAVQGTPPPGQTSGAGREFEFEGEYELELSPVRRVYPDALMEHLALAASESENEAEAEAFIGALIPLAARILPRLAPAVMRVVPRLIRGASQAARVMRSAPATRPLVRTLPSVARNTMRVLQAQAQRGQPITPQGAARTLAAQAARVLGNPRHRQAALRQSIRADQRYHRAMGTRCGCQAAAPAVQAPVAARARCARCGAPAG